MGGHLQDIVAETWDAAQKAIEYLKRNRAGRATFLPLDSLRPARPIQLPVLPALSAWASGPGVI